MEQPFQIDQPLTHQRRGRCIFKGLDEQDPSGATSWVYFEDEDEEVMVTTACLTEEKA